VPRWSLILLLLLPVFVAAVLLWWRKRRRAARVSVRSHDVARSPVTAAPAAGRITWQSMPLYPGAAPDPQRDAGWSIDMRAGNAGFSSHDAYFRTPDPISRVVDWYRRALPEWTFRRLVGTEPVDAVAEFTQVSHQGACSVRIYREPGATGIVLSHTTRSSPALERRSS